MLYESTQTFWRFHLALLTTLGSKNYILSITLKENRGDITLCSLLGKYILFIDYYSI